MIIMVNGEQCLVTGSAEIYLKSCMDQLALAQERLREAEETLLVYTTQAGWIRHGWDKAVAYFAKWGKA